MSERWLTLIVVPSMAVAPLRLMQTLHLTGAEIVVNPLAGLTAPEARRMALAALADQRTLPDGQTRRIAVVPAAGLYGMPDLAALGLADQAIIRLDSADMARAVLRALRVEAWITDARARGVDAPLPIPADAAFRLDLESKRFNNLIHEIQIGRTILDGVLSDLPVRQVTVDAGAPLDLDLPGLPPLPAPMAEPLSDLVSEPEATATLIRSQRIDCPGVDLPPLPAIGNRAEAPVMAFVCGRNISSYLSVLNNKLIDEDIPLIYIDNGSDDGSADLAAQMLGHGIAELHHLPYDGSFSVEAQLRMKQQLIAQHAPRWVLNMDADEILEHRDSGGRIRDLAKGAEEQGYNALNFQEFVFIPLPGEDFAGTDYPTAMRNYYLFEPMPYRLIRMWRHGLGLSNLDSAGHRLSGPLRLAPVSHNLRHYIALSQDAAQKKYVGRRFSPAELARNWHANRVGLSENDLRLPGRDAPGLYQLPGDDLKGFDRSQPLNRHWWAWDRAN